MPTLLRKAGYIFEMVMADCQERRHAHVKGNGGGGAKIWLEPTVELDRSGTYNAHQTNEILSIASKNLAVMIAKWDEECARVEAEGRER